MRVYCSTPLSICLARTYRSPSALALFQSRGCASTTLTYSAMASVDAALFDGLFRALQRGFTIERRHSDCSQTMVSNRVAGLNVRRCCCE